MTPQPSVPSVALNNEKPGLIIGLGLLGLCCFPLGLVAGIMGFLSFSRAKKEGRSPPPIAIIGMVFGVLSLVFTSAATVFSVVKNAERDSASAELRTAVASKRTADKLDAETACALAKLHYLAPGNSFYSSIDCKGSLSGEGPVLTLSEVMTQASGAAAPESSKACLTRGRRWFVLSVVREGECPNVGPEVKGKGPKDDEGFEAEEGRWREAEQLRVAKERVARFDKRVATMRDALDDYDGDEVCDLADVKKTRRVPFAERRMFGDDRAFDDWEFLTHAQVRGARALSTHPLEQAKSIEALEAMGPYLVVFDPETRLWPKTVDDNTFDFGWYEGRVLVTNFEAGEVLCALDLSARSSTDVSSVRLTKLETKRHALERGIEKDFKNRVKAQAEKAMKELTGGKLELDFGLFD